METLHGVIAEFEVFTRGKSEKDFYETNTLYLVHRMEVKTNLALSEDNLINTVLDNGTNLLELFDCKVYNKEATEDGQYKYYMTGMGMVFRHQDDRKALTENFYHMLRELYGDGEEEGRAE